ncbi:MAG: 2-dehydropantoate 2-reductase [SAR202 cluster bacterium]|jgi:2-dehydropantoate 2-reductase|nr:2-dehydropantoate 2-reductase [SAR202 cluster bacterium]HJO59648.1 2-dehydropantoate 2-reductase [SAR202 cluster bacterium]|tara:strand:- start:30111 stop:31172 length:1062 start_codon:yes stop_codon:yes gene_type:complete
MKTAAIGVGAIAGTLAGFMAKEGNDVLLIDGWKEHVDSMNEKGLTLNGIVGEHIVKVEAIHTDEIPNISDKFDMIIVGVKSYDTENAITAMLPFMNDETYVVSPQNSINETLIAPLVGAHRTIGCITTISAGLYEPGHITRTGSVSQSLQKEPICFTVGELNGEITERVQTIADLFSSAGKTMVTDDLWGQRWSKMVTNCMVNATAGITGLLSHEVRADKETRNQILNLAIETVKVGRTLGYNVKPPMGDFSLEDMEKGAGPEGNEELDRVLQGTPPEVPGRPSLAQDVMKGRKTEIDYLNGLVSDKGREIGVETPYSDAVTQVLKGVESGEFEVGMDNIQRVSNIVRTYYAK